MENYSGLRNFHDVSLLGAESQVKPNDKYFQFLYFFLIQEMAHLIARCFSALSVLSKSTQLALTAKNVLLVI